MMINRLCLVLFAGLLFSACKKGVELPSDNGCISQIKRQNFNIKVADSVSAIGLLKQNRIPINDSQLEYVGAYIVPDGDNAGAYQNVFVTELVNGLPVLSTTIWYQFKNGVLKSTTGTRYNAAPLDTRQSLSLAQLRAIYLSELRKNNAPSALTFKDSCLVAQFGYYDLNAVSGSIPNMVKAWSITPQHRQFPQVIVQDGSGALINYNPGLVLF
jgi:hypothetical protein